MKITLRATGAAIAQVWTHGTANVLGNLVAMVLSLPIVLIVAAVAIGAKSLVLLPLGVAVAIVVLPNPAAAGVHAIAHELAVGETITFQDYRDGLRMYARLAGVAWILSLLVSFLMVGNIFFYARASTNATALFHSVAIPLMLAWLIAFILWMAMHLYIYPLLFEQEVKSMWLIYRNAALMVVARPGVALFLTPVWLGIAVLSSTIGLITLVGLAFSASIQHNATARLLPGFKIRPAS